MSRTPLAVNLLLQGLLISNTLCSPLGQHFPLSFSPPSLSQPQIMEICRKVSLEPGARFRLFSENPSHLSITESSGEQVISKGKGGLAGTAVSIFLHSNHFPLPETSTSDVMGRVEKL